MSDATRLNEGSGCVSAHRSRSPSVLTLEYVSGFQVPLVGSRDVWRHLSAQRAALSAPRQPDSCESPDDPLLRRVTEPSSH